MQAPFPTTQIDLFKVIIPNFLTKDEIDKYCAKATTDATEEAYFCEGLYRGYFTDSEFADLLKNRVKKYLPDNVKKDFIINNHFRLSKYDIGSCLPIHPDRVNIFNDYKSVYTINVFLNSDCGGTSFWKQESYGVRRAETIDAKAGTACIFDINILHRGDTVINRQKLLLRTDVMVPND